MIKYLDPIKILKRIIPYNNAIHFILGSLTFIPILLLLKLLRVSPVGIVLYGLMIISILAIYGHAREPSEQKDAYNKDDIVYILLGAISSIITFIISTMKV